MESTEFLEKGVLTYLPIYFPFPCFELFHFEKGDPFWVIFPLRVHYHTYAFRVPFFPLFLRQIGFDCSIKNLFLGFSLSSCFSLWVDRRKHLLLHTFLPCQIHNGEILLIGLLYVSIEINLNRVLTPGLA